MFKLLLFGLIIVSVSAYPASIEKENRQKREDMPNPMKIATDTMSEVAQYGVETVQKGMEIGMNPVNKAMEIGSQMMGSMGRKRRSPQEEGRHGPHRRFRRCGRRRTTPEPSSEEDMDFDE